MSAEQMNKLEQKKIKHLPDYLNLTANDEQVRKIKRHFALDDTYQSFFYKPIRVISDCPEIWGIYGTIPEPDKMAYRII